MIAWLWFLLQVSPGHADVCGTWGEVEAVTEVAGIAESSGLAPSHTRDGIWYTHDDAGNDAVIYAFDLEGELVDAHELEDAASRDWEDLSWGPCPISDGSCLYVGDIGDNGRTRENITVYAVPEPETGATATVEASWILTWPEGPEDSETLFVHPTSGRIYIVTKNHEESPAIYRAPATPSENIQELEHVVTLDLSEVLTNPNYATTGGDWDPSGDRVVIRTYGNALEWQVDPCDPDAHWAESPERIPTADQQGEAIAYDLEGNLITSSEHEPMAIKRIPCESLEEGPGPCEDAGDTGNDTGTGPEPDTGDPLDSGETDSADTGGATGDGGSSSDDDGGCGCGTSGVISGTGGLAVGLVLALGWRRHR